MYKIVKHPENKKKNIAEHRLVMEKSLGRVLEKTEIVHHIDFNKFNNDISNLRIMDRESHSRLHGKNLKRPQQQEKIIRPGLKIELFNRLQAAAALDNRSITNFVAKLIKDRLQEDKP